MMYTDDLSLEATSNASVVERQGVKMLQVSTYKMPQPRSELPRKGFTQVDKHTWVRPLDYRPNMNDYEEN